MARRAKLTRSSVVAAVVVAALLALLLWERRERAPLARTTEALSVRSSGERAAGEVVAVSSARPVSPEPAPTSVTPDPAPRPDELAPGSEPTRQPRQRALDPRLSNLPSDAGAPARQPRPHR